MNSPNESVDPYADFGPQSDQQQRVFQELKVGDELYGPEDTEVGHRYTISIEAVEMGRITVHLVGGVYIPTAVQYMKQMAKDTNCVVTFSWMGPSTKDVILDVFPNGTIKTEDGQGFLPPWEEL